MQRHFTLKQLAAIVFPLIFVACNSQVDSQEKINTGKTEDSNIDTGQVIFDKLLGSWILEDGKTFEQWIKNKNGTYGYFAFSIKNKDTSWNEEAQIYPENGKWVFKNSVKNQNEGQAIKFISSVFTPTSVQFSNPAHDFPTDINYAVLDANTVHAFIVGPGNQGGKDTLHFNYSRLK